MARVIEIAVKFNGFLTIVICLNIYHVAAANYEQHLSFWMCVIQQLKYKLSARFILLNIYKVAAPKFEQHLSFLTCII